MSAERPRIAIVTALKEELEGILRQARSVRRRKDGLFESRFGSCEAVLASGGDGVARATRRTGELCDAIGPAALVGAGVAGALSRALEVGDLVVALSIRDSAGETPPPDDRLVSWALASGAKPATLLTVAAPVVSTREKEALIATFDHDTFAAVDMESAAWARVAASRRIPYLVVRSICDRADEELPGQIARSMGRDGRIRRAAVVRQSLTRPRTIPALMRMRKRMDLCSENLGLFLQRLFGAAP